MAAIDFEISVPQLRCFVAVAEAGSVAEAGRRLGMSAASVSKAITRLEEGAGVRLLHRSTHALSLTDEGEALLGPAREAVHAAQAFEDAAAHAADVGDVGVVRVTAAVGLARNVLAPLMAEVARLHPGIRVDIRATNEIVDLADDGIDLALRSGSVANLPGHLQQIWFSCPWVMCASPRYLEQRAAPQTVAELDEHVLIGFRNQRTGRVVPWPCRGGRYELVPRFSFDDGDAVWAAMLAGAGIACAPLYLVADSLRSGTAVEVLRPFRDAEVSVVMLRRERRLTPARLTTLMEFLTTHAPEFDDLHVPTVAARTRLA
jgi:DNA-binding transcriptional LysR family regulator